MRLVVIVLISLTTCCTSSNDYCGNKREYGLEEIKTFPIYNKVSSVKLGSFKLDASKNTDHIPLKDNKVDTESFFELRTLDKRDEIELLKILVNYDLPSEQRESIKKTVVFCYNPRNAILLYDSTGQVIGYIELCFECFGYKTEPSAFKVGEFCDEKFEILKNLFVRNEIRYGINEANKNEQLENLSQQLQSHPNNPIILTSIAKIKVEDGRFSEAAEILDKVVALDSTNQHAFFYRGHSKLMLNDFKGAKVDFDRALILNSRMIQAYHERALALIGLFESNNNSELLVDICNDLIVVKNSGDSSVLELHKKLCSD